MRIESQQLLSDAVKDLVDLKLENLEERVENKIFKIADDLLKIEKIEYRQNIKNMYIEKNKNV